LDAGRRRKLLNLCARRLTKAVSVRRLITAQERALKVLQFKLDILWQMNCAIAPAFGVTT